MKLPTRHGGRFLLAFTGPPGQKGRKIRIGIEDPQTGEYWQYMTGAVKAADIAASLAEMAAILRAEETANGD